MPALAVLVRADAGEEIPNMKIENLDRAQVFWGLAKDGALVMTFNIYAGGLKPILYATESAAHESKHLDEHPVRVYIVVEDD